MSILHFITGGIFRGAPEKDDTCPKGQPPDEQAPNEQAPEHAETPAFTSEASGDGSDCDDPTEPGNGTEMVREHQSSQFSARAAATTNGNDLSKEHTFPAPESERTRGEGLPSSVDHMLPPLVNEGLVTEDDGSLTRPSLTRHEHHSPMQQQRSSNQSPASKVRPAPTVEHSAQQILPFRQVTRKRGAPWQPGGEGKFAPGSRKFVVLIPPIESSADRSTTGGGFCFL
jgi:hypothetical protein